MRTHCNWFVNRASSIWTASPGKSFLILSPHGLSETHLAALLKGAIETEFVVPRQHSNACPVVLRLSPDTTRNSRHFVKRLATMMAKACSIVYEPSKDDDPSDVLIDIIETALENGVYLILIIERFHAFVDIADDDLLSTLSTLRTLEHHCSVTTIAITPISYAQMRRQMPPTSAFVNSSYGDNHDRAVPEPISREDFVAVACARGISAKDAQNLYRFAGGPDLFAEKLIEAKLSYATDIVDTALALLGDHVQTFIQRSFPEILLGDREIFMRLGVGILSPLDCELFQRNPLNAFAVKTKNLSTDLMASSPMLARWALKMHSEPEETVYDRILSALKSKDSGLAALYAAEIKPHHPRLKCFVDIIQLLGVLDGNIDSAMLAVEWDRASKISKELCENPYTPSKIKIWTQNILSDTIKITSAFAKGERVRLDKLTICANDPDIEGLLLSAIFTFINKTKRLTSPTAVVKALAIIPEAILQSIAVARCGIDFNSIPELEMTTQFGEFFVGPGAFVMPPLGKKLDLTALLVIVPALLTASAQKTVLSDIPYVKRLQSKLVAQLRNVFAHTSATYEKKDADFLIKVSDELLDAWRSLADVNISLERFTDGQPTYGELSLLLYGEHHELTAI